MMDRRNFLKGAAAVPALGIPIEPAEAERCDCTYELRTAKCGVMMLTTRLEKEAVKATIFTPHMDVVECPKCGLFNMKRKGEDSFTIEQPKMQPMTAYNGPDRYLASNGSNYRDSLCLPVFSDGWVTVDYIGVIELGAGVVSIPMVRSAFIGPRLKKKPLDQYYIFEPYDLDDMWGVL